MSNKEEANKHVKEQLKKLFYYPNQQITYVLDEHCHFVETKDCTNLETKQKIYLYCTCCGTKRKDIQEAIDKDISFFGSLCFCDKCHPIWFDLCDYCKKNQVNVSIDEYLKL